MTAPQQSAADDLPRAPARGPTQKRSIDSLNRMIATAREFMLQTGSEDFTLQDVSRAGKVSIGSIYHRFASKEALVRAVIDVEMTRMGVAETSMIEAAVAAASSLRDYVPAFVAGFAENLRANSLMMKMAMQRASFDSEISGTGEKREQEASNAATAALLTYRDEIVGDCEKKARIAFQVIFATLARRLSLDTEDPFATKQDWGLLIDELSAMTLGYLITDTSSR